MSAHRHMHKMQKDIYTFLEVTDMFNILIVVMSL